MHVKPNALSYLVKGKLLSSVHGMVSTLNWVIDFCGNFKVREGSVLKLDDVKNGKPVLDIDKKKLEKFVLDVITKNIDDISLGVAERIAISGGSKTTMNVSRVGCRFSIDVLWS